METMHAAGRRTLPPVPRTGSDRTATARTPVGDGRTEDGAVEAPTAGTTAPEPGTSDGRTPDSAQEFVERLRSAAADFAEAAGAVSAVVREAVPPARHRRSRCRVLLHFADETVADVTFLGPAGAPETPSRHGLDRQIRRWLATGQRREAAWLVPDAEASDGVAVDVSAWLSAN